MRRKGLERRRREGLEEGLQKEERFSLMRKKGQKRRRREGLEKGVYENEGPEEKVTSVKRKG